MGDFLGGHHIQPVRGEKKPGRENLSGLEIHPRRVEETTVKIQ
jgi:hypothetical protein